MSRKSGHLFCEKEMLQRSDRRVRGNFKTVFEHNYTPVHRPAVRRTLMARTGGARLILALALAVASATAAMAQRPSRPIELINPWTAGACVDIMACAMA